jgi:hypothetical protein
MKFPRLSNILQTSWRTLLAKALQRLTAYDGQPGISWEDVEYAVSLIRTAEKDFATGAQRREWVIAQLRTLRTAMVPHLLELVFWVALNIARQKGFIRLGR